MLTMEEQLAGLATMSPAQLRAEWRRVYRSAAPPFSPELLSRGIAYRLQERRWGGLSASARRELDRLGKQIERTGTWANEPEIMVKPGTRLARDWHGKTHHVHVLDNGFVYRDRRYGSLTQIAKLITGTNWSGPRFFGLKRPTEPPTRKGHHG